MMKGYDQLHPDSPHLPSAIATAASRQSLQKLVIFGGSFDPVHLGHITVAKAALKHTGHESGLLLVPAARSPHKVKGPIASNQDRVRMLELALPEIVEGTSHVAAVWEEELHRGGTSYTVDTLRTLHTLLPSNVRILLLLGEDQLRSLHTWRQPRDIITFAEPITYVREGSGEQSIASALKLCRFWSEPEVRLLLGGIINGSPINASSTEIRKSTAAKNLGAIAEGMLPASIAMYIREHGLYRM